MLKIDSDSFQSPTQSIFKSRQENLDVHINFNQFFFYRTKIGNFVFFQSLTQAQNIYLLNIQIIIQKFNNVTNFNSN